MFRDRGNIIPCVRPAAVLSHIRCTMTFPGHVRAAVFRLGRPVIRHEARDLRRNHPEQRDAQNQYAKRPRHSKLV